jgi:hypothetical protein
MFPAHAHTRGTIQPTIYLQLPISGNGHASLPDESSQRAIVNIVMKYHFNIAASLRHHER